MIVKNMATSAYFFLYIYMENFKNLLLQYDLAEMFLWWPCTKIVQAIMICQKQEDHDGFLMLTYTEK